MTQLGYVPVMWFSIDSINGECYEESLENNKDIKFIRFMPQISTIHVGYEDNYLEVYNLENAVRICYKEKKHETPVGKSKGQDASKASSTIITEGVSSIN